MDQRELGEIALAMVMAERKRNGIPVDPQVIEKNLEDLAVVTGISKDRLREFGKIISQRLLDACYRTEG